MVEVLENGNRINGHLETTRKRKAKTVEEVEQKSVLLRDLDVRTMRVRVRGVSPVITHAWSEKAIKMIADKQQKKGKAPRDAKDPRVEFESAKYKDADDRCCLPARAFKLAMVSAATSINDKTFPKTRIRQALFVVGDLLPIISKQKPTMREDPVRLNGTTADLRYRPEWSEWECELTIRYNASVISLEQVINLLELAGFAVGIGEWRAEKNGNFGSFEVVRDGIRG